MKQGFVFLLAAALVVSAGVSAAQEHPGPGGWPQMRGPMAYCPWMPDYMGRMSAMMNDMQQMISQPLTPKQQTELTDMMNQMGTMMHQMCGPRAYRMQPLFEGQLQDMEKRLEALKGQLKNKQ